jgi:hypothetical protein
MRRVSELIPIEANFFCSKKQLLSPNHLSHTPRIKRAASFFLIFAPHAKRAAQGFHSVAFLACGSLGKHPFRDLVWDHI